MLLDCCIFTAGDLLNAQLVSCLKSWMLCCMWAPRLWMVTIVLKVSKLHCALLTIWFAVAKSTPTKQCLLSYLHRNHGFLFNSPEKWSKYLSWRLMTIMVATCLLVNDAGAVLSSTMYACNDSFFLVRTNLHYQVHVQSLLPCENQQRQY